MKRELIACLALVPLMACQKQPEEPQPLQPGASGGAVASAVSAPAPANLVPAAARRVAEQTDTFEFAYSYPAAAAAIPPLKAWLDSDLAEQRQSLAKAAGEQREEAKTSDIPFAAHSAAIDWSVVADLPGWLSLSATVSSFSGGAHPNSGFAALLWDKEAGRQRQAADLFVSPVALGKAVSSAFCDALDAQRAKKRGQPVDRGSGDEFDQCIDPSDATIILGSSNHRTFDRIGFLIAPYSAGPYVEGDYEVTLPVTAPVLAVVKPEYRTSFSVRR